MDKNLLKREKQIESKSYELDFKLAVAKRGNYPLEVIEEIEEEIRQNNIAFEILMIGINAELESRY